MSIAWRGLRGRCPRCGGGSIFRGFLDIAESCPACGTSFRHLHVGDGPMVIVIFAIGFLITALAFWVEMRYEPPMWLHAVLWIPAILVGTLGMLRPLKGMLLAKAWEHRASDTH